MATNYADVYVKLPSGRVTKLDLLPSHQVREIYQRIASEEGVRDTQVKIKYTGKVLKRTDTISYLGICKETILKAEIIKVNKIDITVKYVKDGTTFPLRMDNVDTVKQLKEFIEYKENILPSKQSLKFDNIPLSDPNLTAHDLKITEGSVIELAIREVTEPSTDDRSKSKSGETDDNREEECSEEQREELISTFHTEGRNIEVVFSFDTTGSMYPCLRMVRTKLEESVRRLLRDIPNIRIGIMAMGDYCDFNSYVVKVKDLTTDVQDLVEFVNSVPATGGGDAPECYEWVLRKAQQLDWSEDSAKALVVIGDQIPHELTYTDQRVNWHEELDVLCGMGVKVYGVQALDVNCSTPFYEELADRSGGAHIRFRQFSLITDMFLAVCYKESSPEQLQAFCEEVGDEGRMTSEAKEMFEKLEEAQSETVQEERKQQPKRYVNAPWWDIKIAKEQGLSPKYFYDAQTDKWSSRNPAFLPTTGSRSSVDTETRSAPGSGPVYATTTTSKDAGKSTVWKKIKRRFTLRSRHS